MKKKKSIYLFIGIICLVLICSITNRVVLASDDNTFIGPETIEEDLSSDIDKILSAYWIVSSKDGILKKEDIDFRRAQKIYYVSPADFYKDKKVTAESLKEIINSSEYIYELKIEREHNTIHMTLGIGSEPDPELIEKGILTDDQIAYIKEKAGKWSVISHNALDVPVPDPAQNGIREQDDMEIMEAFLELENIHNAEIYFIGRLNNELAKYAVVFTGKKTETGEDEIIFVGVEQLEYDANGGLVYSWYDGIHDYTKAKYTYAQVWKLYKRSSFNNRFLDFIADLVGTGSLVWICIAVVVVGGVVAIIVGKKKLVKSKRQMK